MTNPTRTRTEIQAEIEKLQAEMKTAKYPFKAGDYVYVLSRVVKDDPDIDGDVYVNVGGKYTDDSVYVEVSNVIPAADLITRAEHEAALADARMDTPAALTQLTREYALDGDTGPRRYTRIYDGKAYVVTVEAAGAEPADAESMNLTPMPRAVAPVGVHAAVREIEWDVQILNDFEPERYGSADFADRLTTLNEHAEDLKHATVGKIIELPPPSEQAIKLIKSAIRHNQWHKNDCLEHAAALLESAKEADRG